MIEETLWWLKYRHVLAPLPCFKRGGGLLLDAETAQCFLLEFSQHSFQTPRYVIIFEAIFRCFIASRPVFKHL